LYNCNEQYEQSVYAFIDIKLNLQEISSMIVLSF